MELDWIWKAALIVLVGTLLLRIAGRKSIAQMTLAQTVIMIAIGSLLIQPVAGTNVWITFAVGAILVITLLIVEYLQVKFDFVEKLITGKSKLLIENGQLNEKNLRKMRFTVDQLEMNLRQQNVMRLSDVEWATLEPNGKMGFALKPEAQSATKKDIDKLTSEIQQLQLSIQQLSKDNSLVSQLTKDLGQISQELNQANNQNNIFKEVEDKGHKKTPPEYLQ